MVLNGSIKQIRSHPDGPLRQEGASRYSVGRDLLIHFVGIHSFKKYSVHLVSGPGDGVVSDCCGLALTVLTVW